MRSHGFWRAMIGVNKRRAAKKKGAKMKCRAGKRILWD